MNTLVDVEDLGKGNTALSVLQEKLDFYQKKVEIMSAIENDINKDGKRGDIVGVAEEYLLDDVVVFDIVVALNESEVDEWGNRDYFDNYTYAVYTKTGEVKQLKQILKEAFNLVV